MTRKPALSLTDLDALIESIDFPVREETLQQAWDLTVANGTPELMIFVTLRAKPGRERELEGAAIEFVEATNHLEGGLGSALYRSSDDPLAFTLVERFAGREAFSRHMASEYFRRFQAIQAPLLAGPVEATFYERVVKPPNTGV